MIRIRRNIFTHDYEVIGINGDTENTEVNDNTEVSESIDFEPISEDKITKFINNYYSYINKEYYDITTKQSLDIKIKAGKIPNGIQKIFTKHQFYEKMYETRDLTLYKTVLKPYLRSFKKELAKYLKKHYNISPPKYSPIPYVSQAWLKMYEMLYIFNLFDKDEETIKTFHGCEIPGNFILATEYFIKNKTNVQNWEWIAQGYKPNIHLGTNPRYGTETYSLTDDYGILENNPDKWDFGEGNGDITDLSNIEYYRKKYLDMDLITFDCGSSWSDKRMVVKPNFAQMIFILRVLKEGGTGLFKMKIPLLKEPIILSMLIFMSTKFKRVYFYKPNQNTWSTEFYVICKNYRNRLTEDEYSKLSELMDDFDSTKEVIDMKNLDVDIINTFLYGLNKIVEQHIYDMKRSFYYIDYFNENDDEELLKDMMRKNRKKLNLWAEEFGLEEI